MEGSHELEGFMGSFPNQPGGSRSYDMKPLDIPVDENIDNFGFVLCVLY